MGRKESARLGTTGAAERAPEGTEGANGAAPVVRRGERPLRWSSKRKRDVVMRLLRGDGLELLSRELCVTAATLSKWREDFMAGGEAMLKSRERDARDEEIVKLRSKIGELTMENELLYEKARLLEKTSPFQRWRSRP